MVRTQHLDLGNTPVYGQTVSETVDGDLCFALTRLHGQAGAQPINICFDIAQPGLRDGLDVRVDDGPFSYDRQDDDLPRHTPTAQLLRPIITPGGAFDHAIQLHPDTATTPGRRVEVMLSHALLPIGFDLLAPGSLSLFPGPLQRLAWQRSTTATPGRQAVPRAGRG